MSSELEIDIGKVFFRYKSNQIFHEQGNKFCRKLMWQTLSVFILKASFSLLICYLNGFYSLHRFYRLFWLNLFHSIFH